MRTLGIFAACVCCVSGGLAMGAATNSLALPSGVEVYDSAKPNYTPLLDFNNWRIAVINDGDRTTKARERYFERHLKTDEAFILVEGAGTLLINDRKTRVPLERNKVFNVKRGTWHRLQMEPRSKIFVIENADTGKDNSENTTVE